MQLKILIIEDDPFTQDDLQEALISFGHTVVGVCNSFEQVELFLNDKPEFDVAFIDIQLKTVFDGVDVAQLLREKTTAKLIFLTSLTDSRIVHHAKRLKIDSYLIKPFKEEDIRIAIEMLEFEKAVLDSPHEIFLKSGHEMHKVVLQDVLYAEAQDNYVFIHTSDKRLIFHISLKELEAVFHSPHFIRCHRSYLINKQKVDVISSTYVRIGKQEIPINEATRKALVI